MTRTTIATPDLHKRKIGEDIACASEWVSILVAEALRKLNPALHALGLRYSAVVLRPLVLQRRDEINVGISVL